MLPLYSFTGGYDGQSPLAPVTIGPDGTLYGTTIGGGYTGGNYCVDGGCGVVFNLKPGAQGAGLGARPLDANRTSRVYRLSL